MSMRDVIPWSEALACLQRDGTAHVLVSLLSCAGSTPREPGSKMVVTLDTTYDTLGGGNAEQQLIERARAMIRAGDHHSCLEQMALGVRANQCCGGHMAVLLEPFAAAGMHIALFGAGHVGMALQRILATLPWRVDWYDSRADAVRAARKQAGPRTQVCETAELPRPAAHSHCIVMTHDHAEDERLIEHLLSLDDMASIGLIGSTTKWARFRHRLAAKGLGDRQLQRVRCPLAAAVKGHKRPAEIALGIAAELLAMAPSERAETRLRGLAQPDIAALQHLLERIEHSS